MTKILPLLAFAFLGCSHSADEDCSVTCIGDGLAISADVCSSDVIRSEACREPSSTRAPELGEVVTVKSYGSTRSAVVLSVEGEFFAVAGPPSDAELGSSVTADSDGALVGVVQAYTDSLSTCSTL
jgi:hypothetical protein